jgi:hypothetical protein
MFNTILIILITIWLYNKQLSVFIMEFIEGLIKGLSNWDDPNVLASIVSAVGLTGLFPTYLWWVVFPLAVLINHVVVLLVKWKLKQECENEFDRQKQVWTEKYEPIEGNWAADVPLVKAVDGVVKIFRRRGGGVLIGNSPDFSGKKSTVLYLIERGLWISARSEKFSYICSHLTLLNTDVVVLVNIDTGQGEHIKSLLVNVKNSSAIAIILCTTDEDLNFLSEMCIEEDLSSMNITTTTEKRKELKWSRESCSMLLNKLVSEQMNEYGHDKATIVDALQGTTYANCLNLCVEVGTPGFVIETGCKFADAHETSDLLDSLDESKRKIMKQWDPNYDNPRNFLI